MRYIAGTLKMRYTWEHFNIFQRHQKRYILPDQCTTTLEHLEHLAVEPWFFWVLLCVPLILSFVLHPDDAKPLLLSPCYADGRLAEQYNIVSSFYDCPILERTVFTVGAVVTDAVRKGADKQNFIKFNQRSYNSWLQVHEAYPAVSRNAKGRCGGVCILERTAHGLERSKKLTMFCFNDRCRVAKQSDFHMLLVTVEILLSDESSDAAEEAVAGLHEASPLLWPEVRR